MNEIKRIREILHELNTERYRIGMDIERMCATYDRKVVEIKALETRLEALKASGEKPLPGSCESH